MDFKKRWTNTGALDFSNHGAVLDIIATHRLAPPLSRGALQPNDRWASDGQLNLSEPWQDNGQLDFALETSGPITEIINVVGLSYGLVPRSSAAGAVIMPTTAAGVLVANSAGSLDVISELSASNQTASPTTSHEISFDINAHRGPHSKLSSTATDGKRLHHVTLSAFDDSARLAAQQRQTIRQGDKLARGLAAPQLGLLRLNQQTSAPVVDGLPINQTISSVNHVLNRVRQRLAASWQAGSPMNSQRLSHFKQPPRSQKSHQSDWQNAIALGFDVGSLFNDGQRNIKHRASYYEDATKPRGQRPIIVEPPITPPDVTPKPLNFAALWDGLGELDFLRIELDALIVMNECFVNALAPDGTKTPLHPTNASISFDLDSFSATFSGSLSGEANLAHIRQQAGMASELEVIVNGHVMRFIVRSIKRAQSFPTTDFSFSAHSKTQLLAAPFAHKQVGGVSSVINAWQLVDGLLTDHGYVLQRNITPDWTLAADSYQFNATPMEVISEIASASGAVVLPHLTDKTVIVQPRYKVSPDLWAGLTDVQCDHVIPADAIITVGAENQSNFALNRVLISGINAGVTTEVVKAGTAGDVSAPDIYSDLAQDHNVNAELGRNILANSGEQEVWGIEIPLLEPGGEWGLLQAGEIVRINNDDGSKTTGLVLGNQLALSNITNMMQSVSLEVHHGNN